MVAGFEGSFTGFQNPAHFLVWHFFVIPEIEYSPLFFRQFLDGQLKFPFQFVGIKMVIALDLVGKRTFFVINRN